jgi:serine/threonine-protein kinase RsbW
MGASTRSNIIAGVEPRDLVGRSADLDRVIALADGSTTTVVSGAPGAGVSELLKHAYDRLFRLQSDTIPFYFSLREQGETVEQTARRFLHQFLLQAVAFRRGEKAILHLYPDLQELCELASGIDVHWIDQLISRMAAQPSASDEVLVRTCISAPATAAAAGARVFVIIDNVHSAANNSAARDILREVQAIYRGSGIPAVLAGRRRYAFDTFDGKVMTVEPLGLGDVAAVVAAEAAGSMVATNDATCDLMACQLGANLHLVRFMITSAAEKGSPLDSFAAVEKVYTQEIFGGRIRRYYDAAIDRIAPGDDIQRSIISLLDVGVTLGAKQLSMESWLKRLAVTDGEFQRIIELLDINEMIRLTGGRVEAANGNHVLTDYISSRFRLEVAGENRAALFGQSVADHLKRAPRLMAEHYRNLAAIGLRQVLAEFSFQNVPRAVLDYGVFSELYKGLSGDEIAAGLAADEDLVQLPQIVYTSNASDLYRPLAELSEKERSAVAIGFEEGTYSDDDEVVWLVAEVESKLEVTRELAEFWCDRLEMAALMCNFQAHRIWLISPEGFAPDAMELLREREAYGSSRRQVELLKHLIANEEVEESREAIDEFEVIVPMDDESELIAANALEEMARRHNVSPKAINQIKTALLEASINASEHSLSPDRRIRQRFRVEDDRIVITISNRGLRLADRLAETGRNGSHGEEDGTADIQRRGWGLKLIEKLMDEVTIERTDDGTSISMTKYLRDEAAAEAAG